jgi:gamma-glutamyltranspeptidase/glutathione hydrolase/leukotriene-C4 hydrolase
MSSTAPTIVEHESGTFALALGGSGGSRIFGAITQALLYWDWGFDISQAVERPRLHDQLLPPVLDIESTFDEKTIVALLGRGHNVTSE